MRKVLFIILILITSCSQEQRLDLPVLNVRVASDGQEIKISDFASEVSLLPIESDVIIGNPTRLYAKGSYVYITDGSIAVKVDGKGHIVEQLSKKGEGPDEYIGISDIQIDESERLWVLSRNNKAIYCYTWDGSLKKKIGLDAWIASIKYLGNNRMLCYIGNEKDDKNSFKLRVIDLEAGNVIASHLPIDEKEAKYLHISSRNHFSGNDGSIYFYDMFCDTIYRFSADNRMNPFLFMNYEGKNVPAAFFDNNYENVMDFFQHLNTDAYAYGVNVYLHQGKKTLICYMYQRDYNWFAITSGGEVYGRALKEDRFLQGYEFDMESDNFFVQDDGTLIVSLSPFMVIESMKERGLPTEKVEKALNYTGEDQNPALLKVRL